MGALIYSCSTEQRRSEQRLQAVHLTLNISLFLSPGVQPLPVRQRADAGQCLLQEAGGQKVAQHGQPQLHQEVHQAVEWRLVHAGDDPEGTEAFCQHTLLPFSLVVHSGAQRTTTHCCCRFICLLTQRSSVWGLVTSSDVVADRKLTVAAKHARTSQSKASV